MLTGSEDARSRILLSLAAETTPQRLRVMLHSGVGTFDRP